VKPLPAAEPLLVGLDEVARLLGISLKTAKRMHLAGELPGMRRLRRRVLFDLAEVRAWVARGCLPLSGTRPRCEE
jgi:excisionase family DNA binding protein